MDVAEGAVPPRVNAAKGQLLWVCGEPLAPGALAKLEGRVATTAPPPEPGAPPPDGPVVPCAVKATFACAASIAGAVVGGGSGVTPGVVGGVRSDVTVRATLLVA